MEVFVIRHAATSADNSSRILGRVDEPILHSEMEVINNRAQELKDKNIHLILTSPLSRAKLTAQALAEQLNIPIREHEDLIERDFGILNGLTWQQFCEKYPEEIKDNKINFQPDLKGAETISQVEERVEDFIKSLNQLYHDQNLILVTHSGVIRIILRKFGHLNIEESRTIPIHNLDVFHLELPD